jgi:hypothetical protein
MTPIEPANVEAFMRTFQGNNEVFASMTFNAETGDKQARPTWRKWTTNDVQKHLRTGGVEAIGTYTPRRGTADTKFIVVDIDEGETHQLAISLAAACERVGIHACIERSRSRSGRHVWVFFADWLPAWKARRLLLDESNGLLQRAGLREPKRYCKIIPGHDDVEDLDKRMGLQIFLPGQGDVIDDGGTVFVDRDDHELDFWEIVKTHEEIDESELDEILLHLGVKFEPFGHGRYGRVGRAKYNWKDVSNILPDRFPDVLKNQHKLRETWDGTRADLPHKGNGDPDRSGWDARLAVQALYAGFTPEETAAILQNYQFGKSAEAGNAYVTTTIENARQWFLERSGQAAARSNGRRSTAQARTIESPNLPFVIDAKPTERKAAHFTASINGERIATERYAPGDGEKRRKLASRWANDPRLCNGSVVRVDAVAAALEAAELEAMKAVDEITSEADNTPDLIERASYVDDDVIAELAWNPETGGPDFIIFDRHTGDVSRADRFDTPVGTIVVPGMCQRIVTPGHPIEGAVFVPTDCDPASNDEGRLRADMEAFINRYVELPADAASIAVEVVLLTWVYDAFDDLPYLAFRTADCGRGKSRALETVGALCYRPLFVGGGSSAAATLRMIDVFGGTLIADEFDQGRDSDLATAIAQILNQGFQRNRPLVKCDGESNQPRAFRCFGPKIFALRKRLGDDATESRTISIYMKQRTRSDIPLTLPRAQFDAEALALRNRLLAFRFANLGRVEIDSDLESPDLEDRANQIGLPLLSVARSDAVRRRIVAALREQQGATAADRSDSLAGEVFGAILAIAGPGDIVRPKDVAGQVNRRRADGLGVDLDKLRFAITPQKVGRIIANELELPRETNDATGVRYRLDPGRMDQLAIRFGATPVETPQTPYLHSAPETPLKNPPDGAENAVCGDSGDSGVCGGRGGDYRDPAGENVPDGWTPTAWADRLRQLADKCETIHPERAAELRARAEAIRRPAEKDREEPLRSA